MIWRIVMQYICGPEWDQRVVNIPTDKKPGIIMSGGIDSFVMYHLLDNPIIFNIARADGFDSSTRVKAITNKPVIEIAELTTEHWARVPTAIDYILKNYDIDNLYYGINHTPPLEYFPEFDTSDKPGRPWNITTPRLQTPFLHLYKYHIIYLANQLSIDLSQTRSCIRKTSGEECGECWQCREKNWGFEQLKK